ncbi:galactokinase family protein [Aerococcus viridans]
MKTFKVEYDISNDLRTVKSPLRICPIVAHSDYQGGSVIGMT